MEWDAGAGEAPRSSASPLPTPPHLAPAPTPPLSARPRRPSPRRCVAAQVVSEDEQKAMIAFYHKKQQEAEKLALEDEDAYMNSAWVNPKALKNAFTGIGDVTWKSGR